MYLDQNSPLFSIREEVIREEFLRRMDIKKELDAVQKKIDEIKKSQDMLAKINEMQDRQQKMKGQKPFSRNYEMM